MQNNSNNHHHTPLLRVTKLTKNFGDFVANDSLNLSIEAGKVHALLGENGAGKSTLVKMMYGSLQPTSGTIEWQGQSLTVANPAHARDLVLAWCSSTFPCSKPLPWWKI